MARPFTPPPPEFRGPYVTLFAAVAVPGILLTATGIVSLALHRFAVDILLSILTVAFAMWVVVGGLAAWLLVKRSERTTRLQHDFVSSVSHELRTPLTGIRMMVETLRRKRADPAETDQCLDLLDVETRRLSDLVEVVLEFGRLQADASAIDLQAARVEALIEEALRVFAALGRTSPLRVESAIEPGLVVRADPRAFTQVLVNLLSNAWKYGGGAEGKTIWLRANRERDRVAIAVEDSGPGVPVLLRRKVFQPFFRGEAAVKGAKPGAGLGLAIAHRLVQAHRGTLRVEPRPGGGARFVMSLPSFRPEGEASRPGPSLPSGEGA